MASVEDIARSCESELDRFADTLSDVTVHGLPRGAGHKLLVVEVQGMPQRF